MDGMRLSRLETTDITAFGFYFHQKKHTWNKEGDKEDFFFGFTYGIFISVIVASIGLAADLSIPTEPKMRSYELVQMKEQFYVNTSGTTGGVFVRGSIKATGQPAFTYYQKQGDGYVLKEVDSQYATIKYTTGTPTVERTDYICETGTYMHAIVPLLWKCKEKHPTYVFNIPEGSITSQFSLGE